MLDVCRLVRVGDMATALVAHAAADRLVGHRAAKFVAEWLVDHGGPDPDPAALDADTGGALTRLATLTASARSKLGPALGVETFTGRVRETTGRTALVVADDGNAVSIPSPRSAREWGNGPVVVDFEALGDDSGTLWVRAAFDPVADPGERVRGGPRVPKATFQRRQLVLIAEEATLVAVVAWQDIIRVDPAKACGWRSSRLRRRISTADTAKMRTTSSSTSFNGLTATATTWLASCTSTIGEASARSSAMAGGTPHHGTRSTSFGWVGSDLAADLKPATFELHERPAVSIPFVRSQVVRHRFVIFKPV